LKIQNGESHENFVSEATPVAKVLGAARMPQ